MNKKCRYWLMLCIPFFFSLSLLQSFRAIFFIWKFICHMAVRWISLLSVINDKKKGRWSPLQRNKRTNENCSKAVHCGTNTRTIENNNNKKNKCNTNNIRVTTMWNETRKSSAAQRKRKERESNFTKDTTILTWKNWKRAHKSSEKLWAKRVPEY